MQTPRSCTTASSRETVTGRNADTIVLTNCKRSFQQAMAGHSNGIKGARFMPIFPIPLRRPPTEHRMRPAFGVRPLLWRHRGRAGRVLVEAVNESIIERSYDRPNLLRARLPKLPLITTINICLILIKRELIQRSRQLLRRNKNQLTAGFLIPYSGARW